MTPFIIVSRHEKSINAPASLRQGRQIRQILFHLFGVDAVRIEFQEAVQGQYRLAQSIHLLLLIRLGAIESRFQQAQFKHRFDPAVRIVKLVVVDRKFRANRSLRDVEPEVNLFLKDLTGFDVGESA